MRPTLLVHDFFRLRLPRVPRTAIRLVQLHINLKNRDPLWVVWCGVVEAYGRE